MAFLKVKGNAYVVVDNFSKVFFRGTIVVAIEDDDVPYCVPLNKYREDFTILDYKKYDIPIEAFIEDADFNDLKRYAKYDNKK